MDEDNSGSTRVEKIRLDGSRRSLFLPLMKGYAGNEEIHH